MDDQIQALKQAAADKAVTFTESGMVLGLGTGTTAILAVRRIAERLHQGVLQDIIGVPTSSVIEQEARKLGIPLTTLEEHPIVDLTIDGADEVAPNLDLIKGARGALLREKIVAQASRREIIIVDNSKLSPVLGTAWAVPIEVIPFGWGSQRNFLEELGAEVILRTKVDGTPFETDHGNLILDANFGPIAQPAELAQTLNDRVGVVEHGLFLGITTDLLVASEHGVDHRNSD
ncbi:ribose-5-phosphate isomerase RpiA [Chloroflexi bacterium TSY]|nr:ribose-5-phosphate isomerase RpiA [Chloroflexi bacterium TSY]